MFIRSNMFLTEIRNEEEFLGLGRKKNIKHRKKMGLKHEPIFSDRNFGDVYLEVIVENLGREKFVLDTLQKDEKEQNKQTNKNLREKNLCNAWYILCAQQIFLNYVKGRDRGRRVNNHKTKQTKKSKW